MVTGLFIRSNQDDPLLVDHQTVGGGELRQIGPGLADFRHKLVFVERDAEARIGRHSEPAPIMEYSSERRSIRDISSSRN